MHYVLSNFVGPPSYLTAELSSVLRKLGRLAIFAAANTSSMVLDMLLRVKSLLGTASV